jgi:predicted dehydrogenase
VYQEEHQAFLDSVDGKRQTESPAEDALVSQEIIEAGLQSWRKGERVTLAPDQEQRE